MKKHRNKSPDNGLRHTGLETVGDVKWGTHFCQFYETKQDLLDTLVPYFKEGLENNESCVWVTSEFLDTKEAIAALRRAVPGFSKYLKRGQMEIFPHTEWYLKGGVFEMKRVLKDWVAKHDKALERGFDGTRVSGNPFWIDCKKDWDDFAAYEAEINNVIDKYKLIVLCTYSLIKCHANEVIDVVSNHEFALIKRKNKWDTIESAGHKKMEEALRRSEKRYRSFIELTDQLGWTTNELGEVIEDMPSWRKYTGQSFNEIKGWGWTKAVHQADVLHVTEVWKKALKNKTNYEVEYRIRRHDGVYRYFLARGIPVFKEGSKAILEWVGTCIDITERRELDQRKDEFISMASHELKTPITSLKAFGQILIRQSKKSGDKKSQDILERMDNQINRLTNLVSDLLDATKIQYGKLKLNKTKFDVDRFVNGIVKDIQVTTTINHEIVIKSSWDKETKKIIYADEFRLSQVLLNFLTNAIKYSPKNKQIVVASKLTDEHVVISVKDNGIGIPKEKQQFIFERFFQAKPHIDDNSRFSSLGLGLYISSEIIKGHKGEIWFKSKNGEGSTFYFSIPLSQ